MSAIAIHPTQRPARSVRPSYAASGTPGAGQSRPGGLRLTRRGRLVVFLAALALVLAAAILFGASSGATGEAGEPGPTEVITVGTGQTLWGIAGERTPAGQDVRETIVEIEDLNALETVVLDAGQRLRVPLGDD